MIQDAINGQIGSFFFAGPEMTAKCSLAPPTPLIDARRIGREIETDQLLPILYEELRAIAQSYFRDQRAGHTLQPTALVHELWLRLVNQAGLTWHNREQFLAVAAKAIRRLLIDHARRRDALKRGGEYHRVELSDLADAIDSDQQLLSLEDALVDLEAMDSELHQVVELRFFGGLTIEETAQALDRSPMTIKRLWRIARAWLHREMTASRY